MTPFALLVALLAASLPSATALIQWSAPNFRVAPGVDEALIKDLRIVNPGTIRIIDGTGWKITVQNVSVTRGTIEVYNHYPSLLIVKNCTVDYPSAPKKRGGVLYRTGLPAGSAIHILGSTLKVSGGGTSGNGENNMAGASIWGPMGGELLIEDSVLHGRSDRSMGDGLHFSDTLTNASVTVRRSEITGSGDNSAGSRAYGIRFHHHLGTRVAIDQGTVKIHDSVITAHSKSSNTAFLVNQKIRGNPRIEIVNTSVRVTAVQNGATAVDFKRTVEGGADIFVKGCTLEAHSPSAGYGFAVSHTWVGDTALTTGNSVEVVNTTIFITGDETKTSAFASGIVVGALDARAVRICDVKVTATGGGTTNVITLRGMNSNDVRIAAVVINDVTAVASGRFATLLYLPDRIDIVDTTIFVSNVVFESNHTAPQTSTFLYHAAMMTRERLSIANATATGVGLSLAMFSPLVDSFPEWHNHSAVVFHNISVTQETTVAPLIIFPKPVQNTTYTLSAITWTAPGGAPGDLMSTPRTDPLTAPIVITMPCDTNGVVRNGVTLSTTALPAAFQAFHTCSTGPAPIPSFPDRCDTPFTAGTDAAAPGNGEEKRTKTRTLSHTPSATEPRTRTAPLTLSPPPTLSRPMSRSLLPSPTLSIPRHGVDSSSASSSSSSSAASSVAGAGSTSRAASAVSSQTRGSSVSGSSVSAASQSSLAAASSQTTPGPQSTLPASSGASTPPPPVSSSSFSSVSYVSSSASSSPSVMSPPSVSSASAPRTPTPPRASMPTPSAASSVVSSGSASSSADGSAAGSAAHTPAPPRVSPPDGGVTQDGATNDGVGKAGVVILATLLPLTAIVVGVGCFVLGFFVSTACRRRKSNDEESDDADGPYRVKEEAKEVDVLPSPRCVVE